MFLDLAKASLIREKAASGDVGPLVRLPYKNGMETIEFGLDRVGLSEVREGDLFVWVLSRVPSEIP